MKLKITVHGVAYEVEVEVLDAGEGFHPGTPLSPLPKMQPMATGAPPKPSPPMAPSVQVHAGSGGGGVIASPIAGNIIEIRCKPGDTVSKDQVLLLVEAMKMETAIAAPAAGRITAIEVAAGDAVREGQVLIRFE